MKKTFKKALRPMPRKDKKISPPPGIPLNKIEYMRRLLFTEVLVNGKTFDELNNLQKFVAQYALVVVSFHLGRKTESDIKKESDRGYEVKNCEIKLNQEYFSSLNFVILEEKQKENQINFLYQKLSEIVGENQ